MSIYLFRPSTQVLGLVLDPRQDVMKYTYKASCDVGDPHRRLSPIHHLKPPQCFLCWYYGYFSRSFYGGKRILRCVFLSTAFTLLKCPWARYWTSLSSPLRAYFTIPWSCFKQWISTLLNQKSLEDFLSGPQFISTLSLIFNSYKPATMKLWKRGRYSGISANGPHSASPSLCTPQHRLIERISPS